MTADNELTQRQKQVLKAIYSSLKDSGYPPTLADLREKIGVSSNQAVLDFLEILEGKKYIKREEGAARGINILQAGYQVLGKQPGVPFLGVTTAGFPIEPLELTGQWDNVSPEVSQYAGEVFLLKINGDSMINAGINDGDYVLVKKDKEFVSGDIVLADVDGESTVKRFISENKAPFVYLKPENPKYKNIIFTESVRLRGKIISVIKKGGKHGRNFN